MEGILLKHAHIALKEMVIIGVMETVNGIGELILVKPTHLPHNVRNIIFEFFPRLIVIRILISMTTRVIKTNFTFFFKMTMKYISNPAMEAIMKCT